MSGHSKWSTIKHQKGVADQKRGQAFTKLGFAITLAVRAGGEISDPNINFKLRLAIEKARSANMPKENIQRAIERAKGSEAGELVEINYEGFGPGGIAFLVQTATDNRQRTVQEIKNILESFGGTLAGPGATAYLFQNIGTITISKHGKTSDEIMDKVIEAGAQDLEEAGDEIIVYTKHEDLHKTRETLEKQGIAIIESELTLRPTSTISITSPETAQKVLNLIDKLEDNDNVQHVFANFDIPDEILRNITQK
ncbi:MAG: YebC/PmpR family DNA-binding transcriptional regulator [Candidatus Gottesmanbacteria bacterium]